jgi:streptogramin lyase
MNEFSDGDRGGRRRRFALAAVVTGIILLAACGSGSSGSSARTYLYWADGASAIGRANLDGTGVSQRFITTGGTFPYMVTVSSDFLYWTSPLSGTIGRASLDGTDVNERFITGANSPVGVVVSSRYIYWSNNKPGPSGVPVSTAPASTNGSSLPPSPAGRMP